MPKISIIVPVYNVEKFLPKCLSSIVSQTFKDWECILIDDGSSDTSGKICDEYALLNEKITVIHQENKGVSEARNIGIKVSKGEYIGFVDSDDWIEPNTYEIAYNTAISEKADLVQFGFWANDGILDYLEYNQPEGLFNFCNLRDELWHGVWSKLIKKSVIYENNIKFPIGITLAEDMYFSILCF